MQLKIHQKISSSIRRYVRAINLLTASPKFLSLMLCWCD